MTTETELKFRIPAARLAALRRAVATTSARSLPLAALYFDTPEQQLAQARLALRQRREGRTWVQTLKAEGAGAMQRLEDNVVLGDADAAPTLDIGRHDGSAAGERLRQLLGPAGADALVVSYATRVQRTTRLLRSGGARIELALDEGWIDAGDRRLAICELEYELLQGPPQALLALAARWAQRFGLVLDLRSKSERGHLLAVGRAASPPARAEAARLSPPLSPRDSPATALAAMLAAGLRPVLANASVLADGALAEVAAADPEYLHQLRVGLRGLRSVLAVFGDGLPAAALAPALATLFGQLGELRDRDVRAAQLAPLLRAAGAPLVDAASEAPTEAPAEASPTAVEGLAGLLAAPHTQGLWLALLAASQPPAAGAGEPPAAAALRPLLRPLLRKPLDRLLRKVRREAGHFARLDELQRHRLRRRIKRLRDAGALSAALWPDKAQAAFGRRLQRAAAALGELNDNTVALAHYRDWARTEPRAWFAVGWLTARQGPLAEPCARALARLLRQRAPWRKR